MTAFFGVEAAQSEKERLVLLVLDQKRGIDEYDMEFSVGGAGFLLFRTVSGSLGMGPEGMAKAQTLLLPPPRPRCMSVGNCNVLDLDLPEVKEDRIADMRDFVIE